MNKIRKGYVQVYTGDGKGKTTAAIGLAIRAAGAGLDVYIAQFVKMGEYSEIKALKRFADKITIEQYGFGCFIKRRPSKKDMQIARKGLKMVKNVIASGKFDVVILEEANIALKYGIISIHELSDIIITKPANIELVITGRYASPRIIELADLVTEMKVVKHYYQKGVKARVGIEK
ncbi:cob(I)yrinic acid a,c-diamide adenosyltransferase [Desulfococcaceae bacterium HSG7]|nr:cob(I)yrinic acid a,c-diamide adenosyltransferase [Desulfococcaceae bacterium HSG7]